MIISSAGNYVEPERFRWLSTRLLLLLLLDTYPLFNRIASIPDYMDKKFTHHNRGICTARNVDLREKKKISPP